MSNNYYSIYMNATYQLARTIVIKSEYAIGAMNFIDEKVHPDLYEPENKESWRYYRNISGDYHFSNEAMYVTSLDTLEKILFSKENLLIHRTTKREYGYGTRYYSELVSNYPDQEILILGILYPADLQKAITAKDGTILSYPSQLIEENEYTFLEKLQTWIYDFKFRTYNKQYEGSNDLYGLTQMGLMFSSLPNVILAIRQEACKTNEAHSFHVWQYLASHGKLDLFRDQLSLEQSLWLYRNIVHVEKNTGQINTFDWLVEHIMTQRNIPIAEYTMRHNLEAQPEELYPEVRFLRKPLNSSVLADPSDNIDLTQMLVKEDTLARDNERVRVDEQEIIRSTLENSLSNVVLTKVLESSMFDYTNSSPYSLDNILLNHWIFLSTEGLYRAFVQITNPTTGEVISLSAKDAFTFYLYLYFRSLGIELIEVPLIPATRVQRIPTVSVDEIYSMVDHSRIPREMAQEAIDQNPSIPTIISISSFYDKCVEIYTAANYQRGMCALQEHFYRRGLVHGMISRIYSDNICRLEPDGTLYKNWLLSKSIAIDDFLTDDLEAVWLKILSQATGQDLTSTKSIKSLQHAMVGIMTQLSSYSVQFVRQINNAPLRLLDTTTIRVGDVDGKLKGYYELPDMNVRVLDHRGKLFQGVEFNLGDCGIQPDVRVKLTGYIDFDIPVQARQLPYSAKKTIHVDVSAVGVRGVCPQATNNEGMFPVPGLDTFLAQPDEERRHVVDMYDNCYWDKTSK